MQLSKKLSEKYLGVGCESHSLEEFTDIIWKLDLLEYLSASKPSNL